ncbi:MAG TPA: type II secretion system F family protein [Burkholderiales bacterium]|nr:type II secretion system F family protein [Burkholderiales bacterium]
MTYFAYKGRDASGQVVQGVLEGPDSAAVATQLFASGVTPVEIGETHASSQSVTAGWQLIKREVKPVDLMLFSRQMYSLLKAGVPILRALAGLQESSTNPVFKDALKGVRMSLESGRELSTSLQRQGKIFSAFYIAMVYVGETTGRLEEVFLRLFHHLEFQEFMRTQVKSALRYPTFVVVVMAVALAVINLFVIPAFAKVYEGFGAKLPVITQWLIAFSNFMLNYWWLLLALMLAAWGGFRLWVATADGRMRWDRIKLRLPIAGKIILKGTLARFARSFALSLRSGVTAVQSLTLVAQVVDNAFLSQRIEHMRQGVERGESVLRTAIASGAFTPVALQMILVGEESGSLDDMMDEVADLYTREVDYELKTLSSQIEPILIVLLGVLVLILALGVFLPIWDLGRAAFGRPG